MTVDSLRQRIAVLDEMELRNEYEMYRSLQSLGVRDEIMITLLEDELYNREVLSD